MDSFITAFIAFTLIGLTTANSQLNGFRQVPTELNVERRINGGVVYGSSNEIDRKNALATRFGPERAVGEDPDAPAVGSLQALNKMEDVTEDPGIIDSILGNGVQSRIVSSLNGWILQKAKNNPGCVERFVCETYRTGETLNGLPYFVMSVTNAAASFMVAEVFDKSVNIKEITEAARKGRNVGSCHTMKCDFMDGQLRTLGDYFETVEEFFSSIYNSVANSINLGKK